MKYKSKKMLVGALSAMMIMSGVGAITIMPTAEVYALSTLSPKEYTDKNTISITNSPASSGITIVGKDFDVYQIFTTSITYTEDSGVKTAKAISYELNSDFENFFTTSYTAGTGGVGTRVTSLTDIAAYAVSYISDLESGKHSSSPLVTGETDIATFIENLRDYIKANSSISAETTMTGAKTSADGDPVVETATTTALEAGYYLINDANLGAYNNTSGHVAPAVLISLPGMDDDYEISGNAVLELKAVAPTIDKEIYHNDEQEFGDVADHQIGDKVQFRITATIPSEDKLYGYDTYTYTIKDQMSDGLDYVVDSIAFEFFEDTTSLGTVAATDITSTSFLDVSYKEAIDGGGTYTFVADFDLLTATDGLFDNATYGTATSVVITYNATLNAKSEVANGSGDEYEDNKVTLEYSNDPTDSSSKGKDDDTVYNYTFEAEFEKLTDIGASLEGAGFTLYEGSTSGDKIYLAKKTGVTPPTYYPLTAEEVAAHPDKANDDFGTIVTEKGTDGKTNFIIQGLDDEIIYVLYETTVPDGYNDSQPLEFVIFANYEEKSGVPTPTISSITTTTTEADGETKVDVLVANEAKADEEGVSETIINSSKKLLPETGGIGTVLFYVVGGVMTVLAAILLALRMKKN